MNAAPLHYPTTDPVPVHDLGERELRTVVRSCERLIVENRADLAAYERYVLCLQELVRRGAALR